MLLVWGPLLWTQSSRLAKTYFLKNDILLSAPSRGGRGDGFTRFPLKPGLSPLFPGGICLQCPGHVLRTLASRVASCR